MLKDLATEPLGDGVLWHNYGHGGAGISMAFSEGLSDTGELTGRGNPVVRGTITGVGTFIGGILHTLPFLIPHYQAALFTAIAVVAFELLILAWLRWRFFEVGFIRALASVTLGGVIIAAVSAALGDILIAHSRRRPVLVVVFLVIVRDLPQMVLIPDQGAVEKLAAASADPAFGYRVHAGRPHVTEHGADPGTGELAIARGSHAMPPCPGSRPLRPN